MLYVDCCSELLLCVCISVAQRTGCPVYPTENHVRGVDQIAKAYARLFSALLKHDQTIQLHPKVIGPILTVRPFRLDGLGEREISTTLRVLSSYATMDGPFQSYSKHYC